MTTIPSILGLLAGDAVELAATARGNRSAKAITAVVLASDSYRVTLLNRGRELCRALSIPFGNHLLRLMQLALFGIDISKDVSLGEGVYFVHPVAVVIGGDARIGARVRFYGGNTVGTVRDDGYPVIEDDVVIGAGARILGPIRVGARSLIGANAVVLDDVPPDHVAVGAPARVHPRRDAMGAGSAAGTLSH